MSLFANLQETGASPGQPGQFGPYYLHELINSGGMADLWLATAAQGETLAVRRLKPDLRFDFVAKRRFIRGCEILARIHNHEHVISYVDHGKINGSLFLAMEYVEGSNLKLLSAEGDPALGENISQILIDMAIALEHVHDSGFMHLDFKPENVLVTRNGRLRLVDFDLARPRPPQPKKFSRNPGTPAYMAPEQLLRNAFDHRADVFAYGVCAYELLTGRKPFAGETPEEILRKQLDRSIDFALPRELNPEIPAAMEKTILKCLERDPEKRYPFTSVLVRDVQLALYV